MIGSSSLRFSSFHFVFCFHGCTLNCALLPIELLRRILGFGHRLLSLPPLFLRALHLIVSFGSRLLTLALLCVSLFPLLLCLCNFLTSLFFPCVSLFHLFFGVGTD